MLRELKMRSEARLAAIGALVPKHLPLIEELSEVSPQSARDVAGRACAMTYVVGLAYGASGAMLLGYLRDYSLDRWLTDRERNLLASVSLSEQDKIDCGWIPEAMQALAWSMGLVRLDCQSPCDDDLASLFPAPKSDPWSFIERVELRPIAEIQAEVDFHYRLHWWIRDCCLTGKICPVEASAVVERRRALDWVYGVANNWDDVPLET